MNPSPARDSSGFTLIEMMISLVLLSLLLGAIYSVFFMSHKALNGVDGSLLKLQESRMALDIMARETEAALFNPATRDYAFRVEDRDIYGKQASRLTFTAFSPRAGGLSAISYYVEEKNGEMILFKKMGRAFLSGGEPKGAEAALKGDEIIEGVGSFLVEIEDNGKWLKTWDASETNKIPAAVRLTITFRLNDRPVTIYETATPMVGKNL